MNDKYVNELKLWSVECFRRKWSLFASVMIMSSKVWWCSDHASDTLSLDGRNLCCPVPSPLVGMSANCIGEHKYWGSMIPYFTLSLMKWPSISMCLLPLWKIVFLGIWIAALLLEKSLMGTEINTFSSFSKPISHTNSETTLDILLYLHQLSFYLQFAVSLISMRSNTPLTWPYSQLLTSWYWGMNPSLNHNSQSIL